MHPIELEMAQETAKRTTRPVKMSDEELRSLDLSICQQQSSSNIGVWQVLVAVIMLCVLGMMLWNAGQYLQDLKTDLSHIKEQIKLIKVGSDSNVDTKIAKKGFVCLEVQKPQQKSDDQNDVEVLPPKRENFQLSFTLTLDDYEGKEIGMPNTTMEGATD